MLSSRLFLDSRELNAAALDHTRHIIPGAVGKHVGKIQAALEILDDADINLSEWVATFYGSSTASAVLRYKERRKIINQTYQTRADNIVGKLTIASLERELLKAERAASFEPRPPRRCPQCGAAPILNRGSPFDKILSLDAQNVSRGLKSTTSPPTNVSVGQAKASGATIQPEGPFPETRGFSNAENYQMIPVNGFRDFKIQTFASAVILSSTMGQAGRCELISSTNFNRTTEDPNLLIPISIPANSTAVIRIHAKSAKKAIIGLFTGSNQPISEIKLSFKNSRNVTLSTMVLSDALRTAKRPKTSIPSLLAKIMSYYLQMCNVIIIVDQLVHDIKVDVDLGPVIDTDNSKNLARIIVEMKNAAPTSEMKVVFSWDIESASNPNVNLFGRDLLGVGTPFIMVEDSDSPAFDSSRESNILAHEVGHGFNLPHE